MTDVNYDVKTGRLVKDVESKQVGEAFLISGCIAVNRSFKKNGEWVEEASFFNFKQWFKSQKQAAFYTERLKKGTPITIDGEFIQEKWEKDGQKQSAYVLMANRIIPPFIAANNSGSNVPSGSDEFPEDIDF